MPTEPAAMIRIDRFEGLWRVTCAHGCQTFTCHVRATLAAYRAAKAQAQRDGAPVQIGVPPSFGRTITVTA